MRHAMKGMQMIAVSKMVARHALIRRSALLAVLAPVLFLAACAPEPSPPTGTIQTAPPPAPVPPARG